MLNIPERGNFQFVRCNILESALCQIITLILTPSRLFDFSLTKKKRDTLSMEDYGVIKRQVLNWTSSIRSFSFQRFKFIFMTSLRIFRRLRTQQKGRRYFLPPTFITWWRLIMLQKGRHIVSEVNMEKVGWALFMLMIHCCSSNDIVVREESYIEKFYTLLHIFLCLQKNVIKNPSGKREF